MSQMVRAQLIFDRRTPAAGLPAWRDVEANAVAVCLAHDAESDHNSRFEARIGHGAADYITENKPKPSGSDVSAGSFPGQPVPFAEELAERLQLARERIEAEHIHLTNVETVADAYLGRPCLKLIK